VLEVFAGQLQQNAEGMSALVQAADMFVRRYGPLKVEARPSGAADRPLTPQQLAAGVVALDSAWEDPRTLHVHVQILKGFHINANRAAKEMIATRLEVHGDAKVEYPPGEQQRFAFSEEPVNVYAGRVTLAVRFDEAQTGKAPIELALTYQACDDSACLPPVTKRFTLATP
jgi:hypothetical protein